MPSLLLEELELKTKNKGIEDHKSMPIDKLWSIIDASEPVKENSDANEGFEDMKPFFKSKHEIIRDIRENYKTDRILRDYKPIRTGNNYIEYESNGDENNSWSIKEYV